MKKIRNCLPAGEAGKLEIGNLEKEILSTLKYFFFFDYPPTLEEIHTFLKKKTSKRALAGILEKMEKKSLITIIFKSQFSIFNEFSKKTNLKINNLDFISNYKLHIANFDSLPRYTLPQYSKSNETMKPRQTWLTQYSNFIKRQQISINKLNSWRFRLYIKLLSLFTQIKLIGLSGSVAMFNADEDHDVDLFIITAKNRLWTGRFIALGLAQILGLRRYRHSGSRLQRLTLHGGQVSGIVVKNRQRFWSPHFVRPQNDEKKHKDKVCLNLFFDQSDLAVPKFKRSEYVAHEVLQMKPIFDKDNTYLSFIDANSWVFDIFPNAKQIFNSQFTIYNEFSSNKELKIKNLNLIENLKLKIVNLGNYLEILLKSFQLFFINRHRTSEIVTDTQLWFHPDDFGEKIKSP